MLKYSFLYRTSPVHFFCTYYNHGSFTILIESPKFRNNSRIITTSPGNLLRKRWIWILCCYHYSSEVVLPGMAKNNPTEKQIERKIIKRHWSMRQHENWRIDLHHKLQLLIQIRFLLDYLLLFLRFLLLLCACVRVPGKI